MIMSSTLEFNNGYLISKIKELEKENLKISELNIKYEQLIQNEFFSKQNIHAIKDSLEKVNTDCIHLKSSNIKDKLIKNYLLDLEFNVNKLIKNFSKKLDNLDYSPEHIFKNTVKT